MSTARPDPSQPEARPQLGGSLAVIVPVFEAAERIVSFSDRLRFALDRISDARETRIVFVDDGSEQATRDSLQDALERDESVTVARLARSFGREAAIRAGLAHADADTYVVLGIEDPPEIAVELFRNLREERADLVVGKPDGAPRGGWPDTAAILRRSVRDAVLSAAPGRGRDALRSLGYRETTVRYVRDATPLAFAKLSTSRSWFLGDAITVTMASVALLLSVLWFVQASVGATTPSWIPIGFAVSSLATLLTFLLTRIGRTLEELQHTVAGTPEYNVAQIQHGSSLVLRPKPRAVARTAAPKTGPIREHANL